MKTFTGHEDLIYSLARHDTSNFLATGSDDGEVRIGNEQDGTLKKHFKAIPLQVAAQQR